MLIGLNFKDKNILLDAEKQDFLGRFRGLMFRKKNSAKPLLFDFRKKTRTPLHSFFVFFDFAVIWLDEENNVLDYRMCKPFELYINTEKEFNKIVEIPINENFSPILKIFRE